MQVSHRAAVTLPLQEQPLASSVTDTTTAASPAASSSSGTSTAAITANDFLQLLVTELQNQDPTANTDPNEYVDQLVQVNSLQQQIQMNQTLDGGPTLTGASNGVLQELTQMNQILTGAVAPQTSSASAASAKPSANAQMTTTHSGNLSSGMNGAQHSAAETIATALTASPNRAAAAWQNPRSQNQAFEEFAAHLKAEAPEK